MTTNKNFIDWELLSLLSQIDAGVSLDNKAHKLGEEYGEFLQALLKYNGSANVSASASGEEKQHLLEELCDVLNVTLDIINFLEFEQRDVEDMFSRKLNKWANKAIQYGDDELAGKIEELLSTRLNTAKDEFESVLDNLIDTYNPKFVTKNVKAGKSTLEKALNKADKLNQLVEVDDETQGSDTLLVSVDCDLDTMMLPLIAGQVSTALLSSNADIDTALEGLSEALAEHAHIKKLVLHRFDIVGGDELNEKLEEFANIMNIEIYSYVQSPRES